ncbi:hypothetical protein FHS95_002778 [Sphingomonas naasensis]|uniref:hypothetical protein n=1 Tax=Sphingomonas naasensis TaxID=1344951 RepID=UPI00141B9F95|nr:hypothetical protein [Sphingomonas naasensis]NIJ21086.1 hypothetical protein [Sphingomonas naasensis]
MAGSTGKKKTGTTRRKAAAGGAGRSIGIGTISLGAAVAAVAAAAFAAFRLRRPSAEHVPTDLLGDAHPGPNDRAPEAFRPDPTAPVPAGERDAFRPALAGAAAPTLVKGAARENERLDAAPS